jgi:hypothetical protein
MIMDLLGRLQIEIDTIHKLYFKNKNQHRKSKHFKNLEQVKRILAKYLKISTLDKPIIIKTDKIRQSLIDRFLLLNALIPALQNTYICFKLVASQTYFMTLSLFFMTILANIHSISIDLMLDLKSRYGQYPNSEAFPLTLDSLLIQRKQANLEHKIAQTIQHDNHDLTIDSVENEPVTLGDLEGSKSISVTIDSVENEPVTLGDLEGSKSISDNFFDKPIATRKIKIRKRKEKHDDEIDDIFGGR